MTKTNDNNFAENYQILEQLVAKIESNQNINIDQLISILDQADAAYKNCKNKIDQVEKLYQQRLNQSDSKLEGKTSN